MLLKINALRISYQFTDESPNGKNEIQHSNDVWINPGNIWAVEFDMQYYENFAEIKIGTTAYTVSHEDARRVIAQINLSVPTLNEERVQQQLEREIEEMNRVFSGKLLPDAE